MAVLLRHDGVQGVCRNHAHRPHTARLQKLVSLTLQVIGGHAHMDKFDGRRGGSAHGPWQPSDVVGAWRLTNLPHS